MAAPDIAPVTPDIVMDTLGMSLETLNVTIATHPNPKTKLVNPHQNYPDKPSLPLYVIPHRATRSPNSSDPMETHQPKPIGKQEPVPYPEDPTRTRNPFGPPVKVSPQCSALIPCNATPSSPNNTTHIPAVLKTKPLTTQSHLMFTTPRRVVLTADTTKFISPSYTSHPLSLSIGRSNVSVSWCLLLV